MEKNIMTQRTKFKVLAVLGIILILRWVEEQIGSIGAFRREPCVGDAIKLNEAITS